MSDPQRSEYQPPPFAEVIGVNLGAGDTLTPFTKGGYVWQHRRPGRPNQPSCEGWIVEAPRGHHTIRYATWDTPPTITPSLDCPRCGRHGFVTDGRWIEVGDAPAEAAEFGSRPESEHPRTGELPPPDDWQPDNDPQPPGKTVD